MAAFTDFFIATEGQTSFETSKEYVPFYLNVFRNGIKLNSNTDVIISSGLYVELLSPAAANDEIVITGSSVDGEQEAAYTGPSLMDKLGFNFDKEKFGNALTVNNLSTSFYRSNPYKLNDWQKELLKTNDYAGFYQNPLADTITELKSQIIKIRDVVKEVIVANTPTYTVGSVFTPPTKIDGEPIPDEKANANTLKVLAATSNTLIASLTQFKSHTDRISGVVQSDSDDPDYQKAIFAGTSIAYYANSIDGVTDFSPILGSFTSLFVKDDMISYLSEIDSLTSEKGYSISPEQWTKDNYFTANTPPNVGILLFTSNDSSALSNTMNSISDFVTTRRNHDKNFFTKTGQALLDYSKLVGLTSVRSPAAVVLLRDLIGTDKLKKLL